MSPQKLRDQAVTVALTTIAALFLTFGTGMWASKENVSAHRADVQAISNKLERLLDVLCEEKPNARACSSKEAINPNYAGSAGGTVIP